MAGYPYNFVLPALIVTLLAVRGFALLVRRASARAPKWGPLLYLLPLMVLPQQLAFLSGRTSNTDQLRVLSTIDRFSGVGDRVIDGAGGALFREHGSYWWVHGTAHRNLRKAYFTRQLIEDYRRSEAIFWIDDFRQRELPATVRAYFESHYIQVDGELYALGFRTTASLGRLLKRRLDVVREGVYHVFPARAELGAGSGGEGLAVDGRPVTGGAVHLTAGLHELFIPPHTRSFLISAVPADAFHGGNAVHGMLFEYQRE